MVIDSHCWSKQYWNIHTNPDNRGRGKSFFLLTVAYHCFVFSVIWYLLPVTWFSKHQTNDMFSFVENLKYVFDTVTIFYFNLHWIDTACHLYSENLLVKKSRIFFHIGT